MTDIENFITNEEATKIKDSILEDEPKIKKLGPDVYPGISGDSLTGRYSVYNWLTHERIGPILKPKLAKLFPNKWIQMWANVFRYNEGIEPHWHSLEDRVSGNLYSWTRKQYNLLFRYRTCTKQNRVSNLLSF